MCQLYKRADIVKLLLDHGANPTTSILPDGRDPALVLAASQEDVAERKTPARRIGVTSQSLSESDTP